MCELIANPFMKTCVIVQTGIRHHRVQTQATPPKPGNLALGTEETSFLSVLQKMIGRLTADFGLRQDLMQECRIHLWRIQHRGEHPCQTKSWYLQNCRFHVQHFLSSGRSLDSMKRAGEARRVVIDWSSDDLVPEVLHTNGELFEAVSARDIVSTLRRHLKPQESALLECLADGWMLRDITLKLGLSYPTALKYRRRIAELTIKLGIDAPPSYRKRHSRRVSRVNGFQTHHRNAEANGSHQVKSLNWSRSLNDRDGEMKR
jgi:DNA-directed RNA polymerase specialized sigma24 family protein